MKKLTTSQWLLGAGIIALAIILYRKQKNTVVQAQGDASTIDNTPIEKATDEPINEKTEETTSGSTTTQDAPIDVSDIPTECLDGFELNGKSYYIKDNKFIKE